MAASTDRLGSVEIRSNRRFPVDANQALAPAIVSPSLSLHKFQPTKLNRFHPSNWILLSSFNLSFPKQPLAISASSSSSSCCRISIIGGPNNARLTPNTSASRCAHWRLSRLTRKWWHNLHPFLSRERKRTKLLPRMSKSCFWSWSLSWLERWKGATWAMVKVAPGLYRDRDRDGSDACDKSNENKWHLLSGHEPASSVWLVPLLDYKSASVRSLSSIQASTRGSENIFRRAPRREAQLWPDCEHVWQTKKPTKKIFFLFQHHFWPKMSRDCSNTNSIKLVAAGGWAQGRIRLAISVNLGGRLEMSFNWWRHSKLELVFVALLPLGRKGRFRGSLFVFFFFFLSHFQTGTLNILRRQCETINQAADNSDVPATTTGTCSRFQWALKPARAVVVASVVVVNVGQNNDNNNSWLEAAFSH